MIHHLHIQNFKPFRGVHDVDFAPLTLVFGPNSAGKSSLLQAMLLLTQSFGWTVRSSLPVAEEPSGAIDFSGPIVDLGSFHSVVHRNWASLPVSVGIDWTGGGGVVAFGLSEENGEVVPISVVLRLEQASFELIVESSAAGLMGSPARSEATMFSVAVADVMAAMRSSRGVMSVSFPESAAEALEARGVFLRFSIDGVLPSKMLGAVEVAESMGTDGEVWYRSTDLSDDEQLVVDASEEMVQRCVRQLKFELGDILFLGPARTPPRRYEIADDSPVHSPSMPSDGSDLISLLAAAWNTEFPGSFTDRVNAALRAMGLPYDVARVSPSDLPDRAVEQTGDGSGIAFFDRKRGMLVAVQDVGYGVSQLLPIIFAACLRRHGTLIVQQPELHLHPGMQLSLIEVLADLSKPDPSWPERRQFILETHSEHMILRIQTLVERGVLRPSDVAILVVDGHGEVPTVQRVRLDERGEFINEWPLGFFEERLDETFRRGRE